MNVVVGSRVDRWFDEVHTRVVQRAELEDVGPLSGIFVSFVDAWRTLEYHAETPSETKWWIV